MLCADIVLTNGNITTMNSEQPKAQALAIKNGKFIAVGTNNQILSYVGENTEKMDLKGKTVVPGFIETHVHGASLGRISSQINLRNVRSIKEIQQKVEHWTRKIDEGKWIVGRGWDQDKLVENRYPSRFDIDQVAPNHPVFLLRVCGHLCVVNSEALRLAEITKQTKTPKGGLIDREPETGEPNGILRENAINLIEDILPESTEKSLMDICVSACQRMVEEGITTAHWIINSANELRALQRLDEHCMLPLRIYMLMPVEFLHNLVNLGLSTGFGGNKIKIGSVKMLADGSLGGRTASLNQPYNDAPGTRGMLLFSQEQLEKFIGKAHEANLQLAIHAIGDRTVEIILKILEKILKKMPKKNHRHRIEHASVLNLGLIKKMKGIGVIASVQPHFVVSDFWVMDRLGKDRARWTYAFKSLLKKGVMIMGGSDAPVEPVSPIMGIYAAVAREAFPQEQLTVDEALRLYTVNAAFGSFEEDVKGSIEKGKFADLVVLSKDPYKVMPKQIREIKVEMTIVDGSIAYARKH